MMNIKMLALIILLCGSKKAYSALDTNKLILNSKMRLINYIEGYQSIDYYQAFIRYRPKIFFLNSTGFKDEYIFYEIKLQDTIAYSYQIDKSKEALVHFFVNENKPVIFAFNTNNESVYKLNGRGCNDFNSFINDLCCYYNAMYRMHLNRHNLHKYFSIEGLDLKK